MLLGKEIQDLHHDGFDGSVNENHVISSVLLGNESEKTGEKSVPYEVTKFKFSPAKSNSRSFRIGHSSSMESGVGEAGKKMKLSDNKSGKDEQVLSFPLVESSAEGVISSHLLLKPLSRSGSDSNGKYSNDVANEFTEGKSKKTSSGQSNDPRPILREHVQELLHAAGWRIGRSERKDNVLGQYIYFAPNCEKPIRHFASVWNSCGETLLADGGDVSAYNNEERQWNDIGHFWNDLLETLKKVKEESNAAQTPETTAALARRWILLDPFTDFLFIAKKLGNLKATGKKYTRRNSSSTAEENDGTVVELFENNQSKSFISKKVTDVSLKSHCAHDRSTKGQLTVKDKSYTPMRKRKGSKGSCRLLLKSKRRNVKLTEEKWYISWPRTILSWLISSLFVSLNDVVQFRSSKDDNVVVKEGLITREGIFCKCCSQVLSLSKFRQHSGLMSNCLFMKSGKLFTSCQLDAWSAEYKARKAENQIVQRENMDDNDDSCGLCGDGGELICCDNCPSTFHHACLDVQHFPEGNWYCSRCSCKTCGDLVNEAVESSGALKCSLCEHKYHKACFKGDNIDEEMSSNIWFCGQSCQEIYAGLHNFIGHSKDISDGLSWSLLKCINDDKTVNCDDLEIILKAECNSKLAVAITIMEESFLSMLDPRTGINMIPHLVYNWGSEFARLDYYGFCTAILQMEDVMTAVASIRIHDIRVAEMPLIATCQKYRRQGMCRRLVDCIEEMLYSLKVEMFVISAIPSLVETWVNVFGFQHMDAVERKRLNEVNLMVFPGTIWLKKQIYTAKVDLEAGLGNPLETDINVPNRSLNFTELSNEEIASLKGAGGEPIAVDDEEEDDGYGGEAMDFDDNEENDGNGERKSSPNE